MHASVIHMIYAFVYQNTQIPGQPSVDAAATVWHSECLTVRLLESVSFKLPPRISCFHVWAQDFYTSCNNAKCSESYGHERVPG